MANVIVDRRKEDHPIWTVKMTQMAWTSAATAAVEADIPINGMLRGFSTTVLDNTNAVTVSVAFLDADGGAISTTAGIAKDATTHTGSLFVPLCAASVKVTPSGAPGTSGLTVDLLLTGV